MSTNAELNNWFEYAQSTYGFVDDSHNRDLVVTYLIANFHGIPSEIALTAFIRENIDNPNLHRLAQPAEPAPVRAPRKSDREVRIEEARMRLEAEKRALQKNPEVFAREVSRIRAIREMGRFGPIWSDTWAKQRTELEALKPIFPDFLEKIDALIAKVGC